MRSVLRVRQQILAGFGGGLALAAGVACGGNVVPSDPDGSTPGSAGASATGTGATGGASATTGTGASGGSSSGGSDTTGAGGSSGTGGDTTGTGGATGGTTTGTGGTTTGTGGTTGGTTTGTGGTTGGTTTGTGGAAGGTTTGTGGTAGGTTTTTGTGGTGGVTTSGGTTTGTGGAAGGTGGGTGGTGGTTGPTDAGCPADAGSPEPHCYLGDGSFCLSAAAIARYLTPSAEGGVALCTLPDPCPRPSQLNPNICFFPPNDFMRIERSGTECCYYFVRTPDGGDGRTDAPLVDARAQ